METLLRYAYFPQRCNQCGGEYAWTLEQVLEEKQVQQEGISGRPCTACQSEWLALVDAMPDDKLWELERAWKALQQACSERGLRLEVGLNRQGRE